MKDTSIQPRYQLCYDHDCPLCVWYTGYFQQHGYLKKGEAVPFYACNTESMSLLNQKKMTNEIPLIDHKTKQVLYGPDAMLKVISGKYPTLAKLAGIGFARFFIDRLYKLISYNRKVIVGKIPSAAGYECNPAFHTGYRTLFITLLFVVSMSLLSLATFLTQFDASFSTFTLAYCIGTTGSFFYLNKQQSFVAKINMEIAGQMCMLLMFASVGILLSTVILHLFHQPVFAGLLLLLWHVLCMQPQFFRRLQFVFFRAQVSV